MESTRNLRIQSVRPLLSPAILMEEVPHTEASNRTVLGGRQQAAAIIHGDDPRLMVVVGPCSIHDPEAGLDYARRLATLAETLSRDLLVVMRVYFEKPRTTVGWKGLINDPHLDNTFQINHGLKLGRRFLRDVTEIGLPTAVEFLDPISPQFIAGLVSWGAIGARTTESQVHRELASGLSMPIGFKNGTYGTVKIAVDAVESARNPHRFLGVTEQGLAAIVETTGNPDGHVILRGGTAGPNYDAESVKKAAALLESAGLRPSVMIDCSHGNSKKDPARQVDVALDIARRVAEGEHEVFGVMLESFLVDGRQDLESGSPLTYGQSITDACMGWEATVSTLEALARAAAQRRR
jgi:3-deoxy-7-phosphoheptulonate synthase